MADLFDLALQNSQGLREVYALLERRVEQSGNFDKLRDFACFVHGKWTLSINMRETALISFLVSERYFNMRELKTEEVSDFETVRKTRLPVERAIEVGLKRSCRARRAFDSCFDGSARFRYLALNVGGPGLARYGEFCAVFARKHVDVFSRLAFVKQDSLHYVEGDLVDMARLAIDLADRETVVILVCSKHEDLIGAVSHEGVPLLVCCNNSNIEAITEDDIICHHLESVRMSKADFDMIYDYDYEALTEGLSDTAKLHRLGQYRIIRKQLERMKIPFEVV